MVRRGRLRRIIGVGIEARAALELLLMAVALAESTREPQEVAAMAFI